MLAFGPEAEGLFQKAILQSGSWMGTGIAKMQTRAEAEALGARLMAEQFPDSDLKDLRDLPYGQLSGKLADPRLIVDGRYIPRDLAAIFASGQQNEVSVLVGSNKEEGVTFLQRSNIRSAAEYESYVRERLGDLADEFLRMYPSGTSLNDVELANRIAASSNVTALGDELAWSMRNLALRQAAAGSSGYVYEFTRIPPPTTTQTDAPASVHGAEIPYVFNNMGSMRSWTDGDRQLAQVMASYWINFADTGSPNGSHRWQDADLPPWPTYTGSDEFQVMEFGDRVGTNPIWQIVPEKLELFDLIYESLVLN
jgi:para-nitrobenzyl esterase